ncbi:MAG: hypothetical protein PHP28_09425 [Actinomycetota bacterium]|nr:hypothetical protein [Actinomycetota bacterium]MDD5666532.1 hypothetical protein [Actinomycetota bacterium]
MKEEERYRLPRRREKRTLAEEISKFSMCYALSEHRRALDARGRSKTASGMDVASIKAGILGGAIRAGDEVEGEALASPFTAIYQPRAYYPPYLLGEMRAALRRGESPPSASPHYLPVSELPPLPDGWRIIFLYQGDKTAFDRPDFPAHVRDVFTRDYLRIPLLLPPEQDALQGRVRFRARLLRLDRESAFRLAGIGDNSYDSYSARGLTFFLKPLELEAADEGKGLRGSLFAELSLAREPAWENATQGLEHAVRAVVEEVFPPCERGEREEPGCYLPHSGFHVTRFRRRFFALVYDPVVVVFRAPDLLGLYLPSELIGGVEELAAPFERFVRLLSSSLEEGPGHTPPVRVEMAYDSRLSWAREGGVLRGPSFESLVGDYPFLGPTIEWLRGG